MQVVDAVQVHIFSVPGESGFPHAKVQIGCVHTLYLDPIVFVDEIQDRTQFADVPLCHVVVIDGARNVGSVDGAVEGDVLPVLPF